MIVTCSPDYITYGFDELKRADTTVTERSSLDRGVFRVRTNHSFTEFSNLIKGSDPIFVRHLQPIDEALPISRTKDDLLGYIELLLRHVARLPQDARIAVQVRRVSGLDYAYTSYGVKESLDPILRENGFTPVVQQADAIISLYITADKAYFGVSSPEQNLSDWAGGAVRFQKTEEQASRSRFKLEEACLVFGIDLGNYQDALDLGASPGGWTAYLLESGLNVTAVDTGRLDQNLLDNPNLRYINKNAAEVQFGEEEFDLLTCDMSWDPFHTVKIVREHSDSLRSGGTLILTIKLMHKKVMKTIEECLRLLDEEFERKHVKQLFHNRDEVTAYLQKR